MSDQNTNSSQKWTSRDWATFGIDVIGVIGIAIAIIVSIQSLNASTKAIDLTSAQLTEAKYESVYGHQLDLWDRMVEHKEVAPYVLGAKMPEPTLAPEEQAAVDAALNNALDFYAYIFAQLAPRDAEGAAIAHSLLVKNTDPIPPDVSDYTWYSWLSWAPTIRNGFENAPGMCPRLNFQDEAGRSAYDSEFVAAVAEAELCK